jgi:hypothetical protein
MMERLLAKLEERMNANAKANQVHLLAKAAKQELLAEISARMDANMTKMAAIRSELEETMKHEMQHFLSYVNESTQNLPEATKIEQDPGMMQSVEEHQDIPREEAASMPVRGLRKRCRVWKLAAERRHKPKKGTRGYCGSRKG